VKVGRASDTQPCSMTGHKLKDTTANVLTRHIQHTAYSIQQTPCGSFVNHNSELSTVSGKKLSPRRQDWCPMTVYLPSQ